MPLQPLMQDQYFHILSSNSGEIDGFVLAYKDAPTDPARLVFYNVGVAKQLRKGPAPYILGLALWAEAAKTDFPVVGALAKEGNTAYDSAGEPSRTYGVYYKDL